LSRTDGSSEPPPLPNDPQASSDWYYERQGKRIGPVVVEVIRKQLQWGEITTDTLVWNRAAGPEWQPLRTIPVLLEDSGPPELPIRSSTTKIAKEIGLMLLVIAGCIFYAGKLIGFVTMTYYGIKHFSLG
jgi:GYF domain 2